jgi:hypothetical protein
MAPGSNSTIVNSPASCTQPRSIVAAAPVATTPPINPPLHDTPLHLGKLAGTTGGIPRSVITPPKYRNARAGPPEKHAPTIVVPSRLQAAAIEEVNPGNTPIDVVTPPLIRTAVCRPRLEIDVPT